MEEKIQQLENEIKELHYNTVNAKYRTSETEDKEFYGLFWNFHIKPVIEYSKQMAEKYDADVEAVWLGAIMHDICRLTEENPHDELGSKKAFSILIEKGFDENIAKKVSNIILTHRCKKFPPETLEQKIVASADAMAHFLSPFYLWISRYSDNNFEEILDKNISKIDRDFNGKIFFTDEKEMVRKEYEVLKRWFEYKI
ncbi:MAG: HD domain-containing protein [Parcubacteria group bacterium]|jgi:predicted hydrolase (HD superfamily)